MSGATRTVSAVDLCDYLGTKDVKVILRRLGLSFEDVREWKRWQNRIARGLANGFFSLLIAEDVADRLGTHPCLIWGFSYSDAVLL